MRMKIDFEQEILRYLREHSGDDIPPTVREIAAGVGIRSTSTVHKYLGILEEKGYISKKNGLNRTVKLKDPSAQIPPENKIPIVGLVTAGNPILAYEEILGYIPSGRKNVQDFSGKLCFLHWFSSFLPGMPSFLYLATVGFLPVLRLIICLLPARGFLMLYIYETTREI